MVLQRVPRGNQTPIAHRSMRHSLLALLLSLFQSFHPFISTSWDHLLNKQVLILFQVLGKPELKITELQFYTVLCGLQFSFVYLNVLLGWLFFKLKITRIKAAFNSLYLPILKD